MKLEDILNMWKRDAEIKPITLDESSRDTPKLHAKYLELLSIAKLKLKRKKSAAKILSKDKWLYYNGKMDQNEMNERGWAYDPFDGLKVMKSDMSYYIDADEDLQRIDEEIEYWKVIVETLTDIVDSIKWRHTHIKNIIDWNKFTNGI